MQLRCQAGVADLLYQSAKPITAKSVASPFFTANDFDFAYAKA
jgi:hypothetical protein